VVLPRLGETPRHGYEQIKAIEARMRGAYSPSAGVIYPTLTLLEELGQVSAEQAESKKLYSITEAGRLALREHAAAVQGLEERMAWVRDKEAGGPPPQILRAMENLKMALRLRLSGQTPDDEQINAMAAALDAAATQIERS
jgi:DNA-binding PadR family transcriptional regulator